MEAAADPTPAQEPTHASKIRELEGEVRQGRGLSQSGLSEVELKPWRAVARRVLLKISNKMFKCGFQCLIVLR